MTVRIIIGDVREKLAELPDESVHCVVTSNSGRFKAGVHAWREPQPHWQKDWLVKEYAGLKRSTGDIAAGIGCTDANVLFWLKKHDIPRRSVSEARALKKWGSVGAENPMYGKKGAANPRYVDGSSPERQRLYVQSEGRAFLQAIYRRDDFKCVRCSAPKTTPKSLHAHHMNPWAGNPSLRFDEANAVTLCRTCHSWVHSNANTEREYIK